MAKDTATKAGGAGTAGGAGAGGTGDPRGDSDATGGTGGGGGEPTASVASSVEGMKSAVNEGVGLVRDMAKGLDGLHLRCDFQDRAITRIAEHVATQTQHLSPREAARLVSDVGQLLQGKEPPPPKAVETGGPVDKPKPQTQRDQVRESLKGKEGTGH